MKLRGPRSAARALWQAHQRACQRERAKVTAERLRWHGAYKDFAHRVHGRAGFKEEWGPLFYVFHYSGRFHKPVAMNTLFRRHLAF